MTSTSIHTGQPLANFSVKRTLPFALIIFLSLSVGLIASLFFKEPWLWMDEVLSYSLLSDSSMAHMQKAIVGNIDANPPLFFDVYWPLGHGISLDPYFLRSISILLFAGSVALFYHYTTRLVGSPGVNALIFLVVSSLIYLNFTLSTQVRSYSLFLLVTGVYFLSLHRLIRNPDRPVTLLLHALMGVAVLMAHNFGLFYVATAFSFVGLLWLWSKQKRYVPALLSYGLIFGIWFVVWYSNFKIQSQVGEPKSWIPLPTFLSAFRITGDLLPTLSSRLEQTPALQWLPVVRVLLVAGLFLYLALPRLKRGFRAVIADDAFSFYLLAGYISLALPMLTVLVSLTYKSIFISRYLWPSMLLALYQLTYAYHQLAPAGWRTLWSRRIWPVLAIAVAVSGFVFYQNKKLVLFPKGIVNYLPANPDNAPVFFESADYFLPLQHHHTTNAHYLLDRPTAVSDKGLPNSSIDFNVIEGLYNVYGWQGVVPSGQFDKAHFPHFFVVDEASRYQIEDFIARGQVKVVRVLPVPIDGHRILECTF